MYRNSTLSHAEAASAVEMFEQGFTARSVSLALNLHGNSVQMLYQCWQLRGSGALMTRERRRYDFDTKLTIVRRHINGESARSLCEEFDLPSHSTVSKWAVIYLSATVQSEADATAENEAIDVWCGSVRFSHQLVER